MKEVGKVVATKKTMATVRFKRKSSCDKCGLCAFQPSDPHVDVEVKNTFDCKVGDVVEVDIIGGAVVKMALWVYVMPLAMGLLGFFLASSIQLIEWAQFVVFLASLAVGFLVLSFVDKHYKKNSKAVPHMVKKFQGKTEEEAIASQALLQGNQLLGAESHALAEYSHDEVIEQKSNCEDNDDIDSDDD